MHPNKEQVRQKHQEACMDEQGVPGQTQTEERSLQRVEARTEYRQGGGRNTEKLSEQPQISLGKLNP